MIRPSVGLLLLLSPALFAPRLLAQPGSPETPNAVTTALWFAHQHGRPEALIPGKDRQLKTKLIAALRTSPALPWDAVSDVFDRDTFQKLAGDRNAIPAGLMERSVRDRIPQSRKDMIAKIRQHADLLTTQFDTIDETHRAAAEQLVAWMVKNHRPGRPLGVIIVCTGNTRRSMLGATMGNIAAAYYGLTDVRFYSGGTDPIAFNPRTIATLLEIGVEINRTGKEAPSGKAEEANPIYRVRWGKGLETIEFSKKYTDPSNPQQDFAAILVCSEADASCPKVVGASVRIPVPYLDPKAFDGAPFEAAKYAERRDDIGRFMLSVLMQVRRRLELDQPSK
jgi:arsenate reductase (thioredoxin)